MKILTVTRYKPLELNIYNESDERIKFIKYALKQRLTSFIENGLEWVLTSGQMGIEMWAAEVVLDLKETYEIQLGIFPPFENQETRWPEALQHKYEELQLLADHFQPLYKGDYRGAFRFKAKDKWFVEKSDASLILMDQEYPGSTMYYHSVALAHENHPIYYITPFDLEEAVEVIQMTDPDATNDNFVE